MGPQPHLRASAGWPSNEARPQGSGGPNGPAAKQQEWEMGVRSKRDNRPYPRSSHASVEVAEELLDFIDEGCGVGVGEVAGVVLLLQVLKVFGGVTVLGDELADLAFVR